MLQYSMQHKVTYWLRTCTLDGTREMAEILDGVILEAAEAATGVDFVSEKWPGIDYASWRDLKEAGSVTLQTSRPLLLWG